MRFWHKIKTMKNSFAPKESDCTLRYGFKVLLKSISYKKTDKFVSAFLKHFKTYM